MREPDNATATSSSGSGQAYSIVFDGGSLGNPGHGYGSYQIEGPEGILAHDQLHYDGDRVTNNQAEYLTLIRALERLRRHLEGRVGSTSVSVRGDSSLVINQVRGRWKVKHPDLQPLHRQAVDLLKGFASTDVAWHRREKSVKVLGH